MCGEREEREKICKGFFNEREREEREIKRER